MKGLIAVS